MTLRLGQGYSALSLVNLVSTLVAEGGVNIERDVGYGRHPRHRLDIYRPAVGARSGPIVLFLYGGGWRRGGRSGYRFLGAALAARGITTVIADYRLYPQVRFPAFNEDAARAYAWIYANLAAGPGKVRPIIVMGHSAGAHMAALIALDKRLLKAAGEGLPMPSGLIGLAGPYAFDPVTWPTTAEIFSSAEKADEARPLAFVGKGAPPTLILHGSDDKTVRLWNARQFAKALQQAGTKVRKVEYPGIGHTGLVLAIAKPLRWRAPVLEDVLEFLARFGT